MKKLEIFRLFPSVDPATISLLPVLDQFHEGIIITDVQGIVPYMNDTQAMIDDLRADDATGKKVADLYRVDGTLLFDEINAMSPSFQSKLMRFFAGTKDPPCRGGKRN